MNRRRPYHFVHPLRGCGNTRGDAHPYQAPVPVGTWWAGDLRPCRAFAPNGDEGRNNQHLGARHVSATPPRWEDYGHTVFTAPLPQCADATITLHSPFSILNSSFSHTFSAKEKDVETGLSYFGARYYSSDLSIWLSVDPMSAKYPSLSPYTYCADNPVKLVDPNGEAWDIDGYKYNPGQNCPDDVSESARDKWNTMNEIYKTKIGKTVIDLLNGGDCLYHVSSDIKSDGKGGFSSKDKTIYLNGNDREVGTTAHEIFHAYQDYKNRSESSIFNEVEANLFSFSVLFQQCEAEGDCIITPKHSPLVNGEPSENSSKEYEQYFGDASYLLLGNFNREKFNNVVSGFLEYSKQNANGKYSNGYKQGGGCL